MKRRVVTAFQKYALNPAVRRIARFNPGTVLVETTGRRTGKRRVTPVGGRRDGDSLWVVAEHGRRAGYVANLIADPRVRVQVGGRWYEGTAHVLPDDDAERRALWVGRVNGLLVRLVGTDLLTIRIDLHRSRAPEA